MLCTAACTQALICAIIAGAASLLSLSSLALPLALLGMARPLPALLHLPVQALAVAVLMRRNPETCAAIVLSPPSQQPAAAAAAVAVVRSAHRMCTIAGSAVSTAALLLAGQPPTRLLAALQVRLGGRGVWTGGRDAGGAIGAAFLLRQVYVLECAG